MKRLLLALALLVAPASASAATPTTITQYASALAGQPTPVHCQPMPPNTGWLGYVYESASEDGTPQTEGPDIYLAPETCYPLALAMRHATPGTYAARLARVSGVRRERHETVRRPHSRLSRGR